MVFSLLVFAATYVLIASERVDKTVAAVLGAAVVIFFHLIPYDKALAYVDLNVVYLLVGMMIVVNVFSRTGLFEWIAITIAQAAKGNGVLILAGLVSVTAFVSAFLDNVTTVILIAPITILVTQILEIPAAPFLILEAIFSNIGGTSTSIGDPPNIMISSQTHLTFNDFLFNLTPVILVIHVCVLAFALLVFRKRLRATESARQRIMDAHPHLAIIDRSTLVRSLSIFFVMVIGFFFAHLVNIEPGIIALAGGILMLGVCRCDVHETMAKVDWNTIFFFIGLFMLIGALDYNGVFERAGRLVIGLTGNNFPLTVVVVLWFSAFASSVVDNVPLVLAMIPVIKSLVPIFGASMGLNDSPELLVTTVTEPLYWALALGACLGGNGTLVGASANVVIVQIARRNNYTISFMGFTRYGLPVMIASLVISTLFLLVRPFLLAL